MEPRAYFDPPCEREWTIAEREEFFSSQDAVTGFYNGITPDAVGKTMGRYGYGAFKFADLLVGDQFYISWRGTSLFTKISDKQAQFQDAEPKYFDEYTACRLVPKDRTEK